jgi:hypothetical protein
VLVFALRIPCIRSRLHGAAGAVVTVVVVLLASVPILVLGREDVALLEAILPLPSPRFCFGDPGLSHVVSFVLPPVVAAIAMAMSLRGFREESGRGDRNVL